MHILVSQLKGHACHKQVMDEHKRTRDAGTDEGRLTKRLCMHDMMLIIIQNDIHPNTTRVHIKLPVNGKKRQRDSRNKTKVLKASSRIV